jgi:hypothetical protein
MNNVFKYAMKTPLTTEDNYPYKPIKGTCKYVAGSGVVSITSYTDVTPNDPAALMAAIAIKPVSVAVRSAATPFRYYKSGILNSSSCGTTLDHAVIAIGYGELNGTPYWLIRNSWGKSWGEAGYVKLFRGTANDAGMCGVLKRPSYPNI